MYRRHVEDSHKILHQFKITARKSNLKISPETSWYAEMNISCRGQDDWTGVFPIYRYHSIKYWPLETGSKGLNRAKKTVQWDS